MAPPKPLELWLVRHAHAGERGPDHPDDRLRPLSPKGQRQIAALNRWLDAQETRFDRLFASPLLRARQTAAPLAAFLNAADNDAEDMQNDRDGKSRAVGHRRGERRSTENRRAELLEALADSDYAGLLAALGERLGATDERLALVGHEPYLSELASLLLCGDARALRLEVGKGALLRLRGELRPAGMSLSALVPASSYRRCG